MAENPPYMLSTGLLPKILTKIQEARKPDRFTIDFLETKLGFSGGSARAALPLLKRIGFLGADGTPTTLYDKFRNPDTQGKAMATALRGGYKDLFDRNEYAHDLPKEKLQALIVEMTGLERDNRIVQSIVSTFSALKELLILRRCRMNCLPRRLPNENNRLRRQRTRSSIRRILLRKK